MAQVESQVAGAQKFIAEQNALPFPATTKQAAGVVGGVQTDVMSVWFTDKIMFTITQKGRIGHWVWHIFSPMYLIPSNRSLASCSPGEPQSWDG